MTGIVTSASACKIISHLGGGLYVVEVQYDDIDRLERIDFLNNRLTSPSDPIYLQYKFKSDLDEAIAYRESLVAPYNAAIAYLAFAESEGASGSELIPMIEEVRYHSVQIQQAKKAVGIAQHKYNKIMALKHEIEVELWALNDLGAAPNPRVQAWCIDLADGEVPVGGGPARAKYNNGDFVPLVCLNYDTTTYLLPPLNPVSAAHGGTGVPFPIDPEGTYNVMTRYRQPNAACFAFWNAAMEPGFAKWKPILLLGIFQRFVPDCSGSPSPDKKNSCTVRFPSERSSRFGYELAYGEYVLPIAYFDGPEGFKDGDEVVCLVTVGDKTRQKTQPVVTGHGTYFAKSTVTDLPTITGKVIGYAHNPKVKDKIPAYWYNIAWGNSTVTDGLGRVQYDDNTISDVTYTIEQTDAVVGTDLVGTILWTAYLITRKDTRSASSSSASGTSNYPNVTFSAFSVPFRGEISVGAWTGTSYKFTFEEPTSLGPWRPIGYGWNPIDHSPPPDADTGEDSPGMARTTITLPGIGTLVGFESITHCAGPVALGYQGRALTKVTYTSEGNYTLVWSYSYWDDAGVNDYGVQMIASRYVTITESHTSSGCSEPATVEHTSSPIPNGPGVFNYIIPEGDSTTPPLWPYTKVWSANAGDPLDKIGTLVPYLNQS
jgi:hypothetical protein